LTYKGTIILESLKSDFLVSKLNITKKETWNVTNNNPQQPAIWTAISFENTEDSFPEIISEIQSNLKDFWYVDVRNRTNTIIIFPTKVFSYKNGDLAMKEKAIVYGKSMGIPESQLDWP
jgi:hypothetical protein